IGYAAFSMCTALTDVSISEGVDVIVVSAFRYCLNLASVTIPESVNSIGRNAFDKCESLTSVIIPEGVSCIDEYTFYECTNLASVGIPSTITSIGSYAFVRCRSLHSVSLPERIDSIGEGAFAGCTGLTDFYCLNPIPPIAGTDAFSEVYARVCTLHVPEGSLDSYKQAEEWKDLLDISIDVPQTTAPSLTILTDGDQLIIEGTIAGEVVQLYTTNGTLVNSVVSDGNPIRITVSAGALYFARIGNTTVKIAL
ncbi:MAG: leucine-rich repeat domain-containing protein, partial [Bacteroidales bacterium]|nr:leucine-rich repeat domain-containing protein [Bacteroidales bacterium]